ncbi:unnamed protein product [Ambrosiozyma monospora]|uniref:Unnamed protein product n=1 Tax=Ambrosiozyma monospora TaxID=43982 RepID=A0A9W6Z7F7_AMBMO|nr:unnamed protein product [Ambrosiozyma monospora]
MVGPKVPKEVQEIRDLRLGRGDDHLQKQRHSTPVKNSFYDQSSKSGKITKFFDTGKSLNDEVKGEMMKNISKTRSNRFEE